MAPSKVRQIIIPITPQLNVLPDRFPSDRLGSPSTVRRTLKQIWSSSRRAQLTMLKGGRGSVSIKGHVSGKSSGRVGPTENPVPQPMAVVL
jgi:hypothetical protein